MPKRFGFSKGERLKSRKQIDALFEGRRSIAVFPIKAFWQFTTSPEKPGLQVGFTVSKKYFKKAVDRNRIKRLLREAYRLQKEEFVFRVKGQQKYGAVFFVYTDKTIASFESLQLAMAKCLQRLLKTLQIEDPS